MERTEHIIYGLEQSYVSIKYRAVCVVSIYFDQRLSTKTF